MERRVRTAWRLRQRYRRAANLAGAIGALAALAIVLFIAGEGYAQGAVPSRGFVIVSLLFVALSALVPRFLVLALWRLMRRRHYWEWQ